MLYGNPQNNVLRFWATFGSPYAIGPLSALSVSVSVCDIGVLCQTVGWIRRPLVMEVGLGLGHIVLDGDPAPPQGHNSPTFRPMSIVAKRPLD